MFHRKPINALTRLETSLFIGRSSTVVAVREQGRYWVRDARLSAGAATFCKTLETAETQRVSYAQIHLMRENKSFP